MLPLMEHNFLVKNELGNRRDTDIGYSSDSIEVDLVVTNFSHVHSPLFVWYNYLFITESAHTFNNITLYKSYLTKIYNYM